MVTNTFLNQLYKFKPQPSNYSSKGKVIKRIKRTTKLMKFSLAKLPTPIIFLVDDIQDVDLLYRL